MSNNNAYWGRKSGTVHKDGTNAFRQRQWSYGASRDGKNHPRRFVWPLPFKSYGSDTQKLLLGAKRRLDEARKAHEEQLRREL